MDHFLVFRGGAQQGKGQATRCTSLKDPSTQLMEGKYALWDKCHLDSSVVSHPFPNLAERMLPCEWRY